MLLNCSRTVESIEKPFFKGGWFCYYKQGEQTKNDNGTRVTDIPDFRTLVDFDGDFVIFSMFSKRFAESQEKLV